MQITSPNLVALMGRKLLASSGSAQKTAVTQSSDQKSDPVWSADHWRKLVDDGDAEVRAAQKIADAKKELEFLRRSGFPPDVVARLAQELLHRVSAAAAEYATSTSDNEATVPGTTPTPSLSAVVEAKTSEPLSSTDEATTDAGKVAQVNSVYLSVMGDQDRSEGASSKGDTSEKFRSLVAEIKALLAKAERDETTERSDAAVGKADGLIE